MELSRSYANTRFAAEVVKGAIAELSENERVVQVFTRNTRTGSDSWEFDTDEEFISAYRKRPHWFTYSGIGISPETRETTRKLRMSSDGRDTTVTIQAPTRAEVETAFEVFEGGKAAGSLPTPLKVDPPPIQPRIFIGHGRSAQWRDLKDHLQDKHGLDVVAFEVGARAGHGIRDILSDLLQRSTMALLVLTGEDEMADGELRPRENVVHETGLFQGRLGFDRAIVLVEDGVDPFSNLHGILQLRFSANNIREVFGDVVATIRREFPV